MAHDSNAIFELPHEKHHSILHYVVIWALLLVLTVATYTFFKMDLGAWALPVAMAIAVTKALLVILFFMHLYDQKGAFGVVLFVSVVFVALLIGLTVGDIATRFPLTNPPSGQRDIAPRTGNVHFPVAGDEAEKANLGHQGKHP